jgi:hypothetical protein
MASTRLLAAAAASAALVLTAATPADAERWDRSDRVGDGPNGGDISHLTVANRVAAVHIDVDFDNLIAHKSGRDFFVIDTQRKDGYDYILYTRWRSDGAKSRMIRAVPFSESDAHTVRCPDLAVHWRPKKDRIDVNIPQECLNRPTPLIRAGFYSTDKKPTADDWAPRQYATYGPWLDVG